MKLRIGQKFNHFDGEEYVTCIITCIEDRKIQFKALTDFYVAEWWEIPSTVIRYPKTHYYYTPIITQTKLGKVLYKC